MTNDGTPGGTPGGTPDKNEWQTYVHRRDASVRYLARRVDGATGLRYELKEPSGEDGGDIDAGFFEAVYEIYSREKHGNDPEE